MVIWGGNTGIIGRMEKKLETTTCCYVVGCSTFTGVSFRVFLMMGQSGYMIERLPSPEPW